MTRDYVTLRLEFVRLQQDAERFAEHLRDAERKLRKTGELDLEIESQLSQLLHDWDSFEHVVAATADGDEAAGSVGLSKLSRLEEKLDELQIRERACLILQSVREIRYVDGTDSSELQSVHRQVQMLEDSLDEAESSPDINRLVEGTHPANALLSLIRDGERLSDKDWAELQETVAEAYGPVIATAAVRGRLTCKEVTESTVEDSPGDGSTEFSEETPGSDVFPSDVPSEPVDVAHADDTLHNIGEENLKMHREYPAIHIEEPTSETPVEKENSIEFLTRDEPSIAPLLMPEDDRTTTEEPPLPLLADNDQSDESIFDRPEDAIHLQGPALIKEQSDEWEQLQAAAMTTDRGDHEHSDDDPQSDHSDRMIALPKNYRTDTGPVQEAAHAALTDSALFRDRHMSDVILHLAENDRFGLAVYVARGQEARGEQQVPFLPSWLLEAMTLAPHVTFARGRLAAMLEESLSQCHERVWHDLSDEWRKGLGFFVRAATLRPSVISPGTRAAAILRSFNLNADCTELYNYCSRIATFGERLQGLMPALFTQRQSHLSRDDHLRALQAEVGHWSELLRERSVEYTPAKQLFLHANWSVKSGSAVRHSLQVRRWQKWQQTLRLTENIIKPVRVGDSDRMPEVKAEIRRISNNLRDGTWSETDSEAEGDGQIRIPHPAMKNVLREAMAYAQRWVSLHSGTPEETDFFLPQAAEELRAEVLDRHDAVIRELQLVRENSEAKVVISGVTCLLRAVHQLREMVDPSGPVNPSEADPRHLMSAELLKIPGMRLDDRWEPPMDELSTQSRILRFLADPQPDWETAYQVRCESGDRIATERLLELDVWDSTEHKDVLREVRDQYIQPTRESLIAELMQFEKRLQIIADEERQSDDQIELENRLRRLRDSLVAGSSDTATVSKIEWCRQELAALRNGFRALQAGEPAETLPTLPDNRPGLPDDHLQH